MKTLLLVKALLIAAAYFTSSPAQAWWRCPGGGYDLQTRNGGNEVRCFRPAQTQTATLNTNCPQVQTPLGPIGAGFKRDHYRDGRDACITQDPTGTAQTAVPHAFCPAGYSHVPVRNANDTCRKTTPSSETTPNVNV